jgi:hypothetical protein
MGGRRRLPLDRLARPVRQFEQHVQGFAHRALANHGAPERTETAFALNNTPVARGCSEVNKSDRLASRCAARACNTGDRHDKIDTGAFQRADGHGRGGFAADGSKVCERIGFNAQDRSLGFVGVGDKATIEDCG